MKVQIYEHVHPDDAFASVQSGVDFIGIKPGEQGRSPGELNYTQCREVLAAVPPDSGCLRVALTVSTDLAAIAAMVQAVKPDVIHLSGSIEDLEPAEVAGLRFSLGQIRVMLAIPIAGPASIELAKGFEKAVDFLLLDSGGRDKIVGATGETHDWNISAELVRRVHLPAILAGGLCAENVAAAIKQIRPWGVDSFTHTNVIGSRRKDMTKVAAFADNARIAGYD